MRRSGRRTARRTAPPMPAVPNDAELAALLAEVENLSDAEAARLLADEQQAK